MAAVVKARARSQTSSLVSGTPISVQGIDPPVALLEGPGAGQDVPQGDVLDPSASGRLVGSQEGVRSARLDAQIAAGDGHVEARRPEAGSAPVDHAGDVITRNDDVARVEEVVNKDGLFFVSHGPEPANGGHQALGKGNRTVRLGPGLPQAGAEQDGWDGVRDRGGVDRGEEATERLGRGGYVASPPQVGHDEGGGTEPFSVGVESDRHGRGYRDGERRVQTFPPQDGAVFVGEAFEDEIASRRPQLMDRRRHSAWSVQMTSTPISTAWPSRASPAGDSELALRARLVSTQLTPGPYRPRR
jgi:hypothetical protein